MTLDEKVGDGDSWAKSKFASIRDQLGRGLAYSAFIAMLGIGVPYMFGARWAQDVRASFDSDYGHKIANERTLDMPLPSDRSTCLALGTESIRVQLFNNPFEVFIQSNGSEYLLTGNRECIGLDCKEELYNHIMSEEYFGLRAEFAAPIAANTSKIYSCLLSCLPDRDGNFIQDASFFVELYKADWYRSDVLKIPSGRINFWNDIKSILEEHSWADAEKIIRGKYK